ncbi:MAG: uroporphyrinogen decarboxylase family protein [Lacunisphaera sp.]|nr:uroporphyrinogen decarboxylase family protein [Lacunisphaera sp.]
MMSGGRPAWLPLHLPITPPVADLIEKQTGVRSPELAFETDFGCVWAGCNESPSHWREALAGVGCQLPAHAEIGPFCIAHLAPPAGTVGPAYHFRIMLHPLEQVTSVAQLEKLPWPDTADPQHYSDLPRRMQQIHTRGKVAFAGLECTTFESAWYVRGMDNLFQDLAEANGIADWLLDWFTERSCHAGRAYARAGADIIGLGDDVGMQTGLLLSVPMWRQHLKPRLARVIAAIRAASAGHKVWIQYHSDGDISPLVPDLIEVGVDILNPVQPECMDAAALVRRHGKALGLSGMIGTQTTMPFGTPADVRRRVREIAALHREQGGRVLASPTHVLEPDVPFENILALVEEAKSIRFD